MKELCKFNRSFMVLLWVGIVKKSSLLVTVIENYSLLNFINKSNLEKIII